MIRAMIHLNNIHSLTEFQRNTRGFVAQAKESKSPIVLTVNGKAELVVQDAESYQALLDRLDYLETVAGLRQSQAEFERGEGVPVNAAFEGLRAKHGLPR